MVVEQIKKEITPNEKQTQCINSIEGKFMVLAGPGTGKTFTLINRIQNMLLMGIEPSKILCLTFSQAAANEMKERLIKNAGTLASSINVYTYHAFCNDIISQNPDKFALATNFKIIKEAQKLEIMKQVINEATLIHFVPPNANKYYYAKNFTDIAQKVKALRMNEQEYLSYLEKYYQKIQFLESEIHERELQGKTQNKGRLNEIEKTKKDIEKAKEVWQITALYKEKMLKNGFIDFSDMINFVLDTFREDNVFLKEISNKFSHILVDEYQDTNTAQNELIFNLIDASNTKNVFVVGDDDQIIFGFQGAKDDNIENFKAKYQDTKVICLCENNRSTQSILDLSHALMAQNKNRIENNPMFKDDSISKKLTAKNKKIIAKEKRVRRWHFNNSMQELNGIIDDIVRVVNSPLCPKNDKGDKKLSEIAVLSRERAQINSISQMLAARNIPFQVDEGKDIFLIRSCILAYFYIKALTNPALNSDKLFGLLLCEPFLINNKDYNKILEENLRHKKENRKDFIQNMRILDGFEEPHKIKNFLETFDKLKRHAETHNLRDTVVEILNRTGILNFFFETEENRFENIEGLKTLIDEAGALMELNKTASLKDFVSYLDMTFENDIPIVTPKNTTTQNAIQLLTYHKSKGREFEYVYMPNLCAKKWEDYKGRNGYKLITEPVKDEDKTDAELLKLLFVGITRAKHALTLSFADFTDEKPQNITKYLTALEDFDFEKTTFEYTDNDFLEQYRKIVSNEVYDNKKAIEDTLKAKIATLKLSPSRLNDYLECPRRFYYTKILEIDIEQQNWDHANFGSVMHKVLENAEKLRLSNGFYPALNDMLKDFEKKMDFARFSNDAVREKFETTGTKMLEDYYPTFSDLENDKLYATEACFDGITLQNYRLSGKIDRVEKNADGTYSLYDYKTGSPVSEKQVAIGGSNERYYNQLCFYKYAWEKLTSETVQDASLIYLKDTSKNVRKTLETSDIEYIENLISETYKKIENLEFNPPEKRNETECARCAYKNLCTLDVI